MSLILLIINELGNLLGAGVTKIIPPITDAWENHINAPLGDASESNPWVINSAENLAYLINNMSDGTYYIELNSDINLAGYNWTPIKTKNKNIRLFFNGKKYTISNMTIFLAITLTNLKIYPTPQIKNSPWVDKNSR